MRNEQDCNTVYERRSARAGARPRGRRRRAVLQGGELRFQSPVLPRRTVGFKNVRARRSGTLLPCFGVRATVFGFQFLQALRHEGQLVAARAMRGDNVLPCSVLLCSGLPGVHIFSAFVPVPGTAANFPGRQFNAVLECLFWSKPFDGGSKPSDTRRAVCGQVANGFVVWRSDLVGAEDHDLAATHRGGAQKVQEKVVSRRLCFHPLVDAIDEGARVVHAPLQQWDSKAHAKAAKRARHGFFAAAGNCTKTPPNELSSCGLQATSQVP